MVIVRTFAFQELRHQSPPGEVREECGCPNLVLQSLLIPGTTLQTLLLSQFDWNSVLDSLVPNSANNLASAGVADMLPEVSQSEMNECVTRRNVFG